MIISVSGMGYTGSGAVKDILTEYNVIQADDKLEFNLLYIPDGIVDIEAHLMDYVARFQSSDAAIKRFIKLVELLNSPRGEFRVATHNKFYNLSMKYINAITQVEWYGRWDYDRLHESQMERTIRYRFLQKVYPIFEKKRAKDIHLLIDKKMYFSIKPENFYDESRNYIKSLLKEMGYDLSKPLVLDQAVPFNNPEKYEKYFDELKVIVVDKDPRDLYLLIKKIIRSKASWFPHDRVEDFVKYYKVMRENVNHEPDFVLSLHFEDLIYEYDKSINKIKEFLNIGEPDRPGTFFKPQESINNTQLFNRFPDMQGDIEYIEKHLAEYLYDYGKYEKRTKFGVSF